MFLTYDLHRNKENETSSTINKENRWNFSSFFFHFAYQDSSLVVELPMQLLCITNSMLERHAVKV